MLNGTEWGGKKGRHKIGTNAAYGISFDRLRKRPKQKYKFNIRTYTNEMRCMDNKMNGMSQESANNVLLC
jgi:hypothetical protein